MPTASSPKRLEPLFAPSSAEDRIPRPSPTSKPPKSSRSGAGQARRTQEQRTAGTRAALLEAAITMIDRQGYAGTNNAAIADEAGVSRGAITHHFATRAAFMAEVVRYVFEEETRHFDQLMSERREPLRVEEWPRVLWEVFSRPSGVAVMEILVASRSDAELAQLTRPMQQAIERQGAEKFLRHAGASAAEMAAIRMNVWAIRGMTLAKGFTDGAGVMEDAIALFGKTLQRAVPSGGLRDLVDLASDCAGKP